MMETAAPGLHDAILLCAGVAAVYLVVAVLQLVQLKRHSDRDMVAVVREPSLNLHQSVGTDRHEDQGISFAAQLKRRNIEAEQQRLGVEVERLHVELAAVRDELRQLRSQRNMLNVPNVMPLYNEAMGFARRGLDATGIATRCGISMGEAELVAALARNPNDYGLANENPQSTIAVNGQHDRQPKRYRAAA